MPFSLTTGFVVLTVIVFIALLLWAYLRSRQGDQRVIDTINSMILPMLSILIVITNLLFWDLTPVLYTFYYGPWMLKVTVASKKPYLCQITRQ